MPRTTIQQGGGTRQPLAPPASDGELLVLLRQGQAKAFEQLMRTHNRMLFRAARGIVGDDGEAQDAVQETYLRAFLSLDSFRGESTLATWLVRIAINQALGQQRKLGRLVRWHDGHRTEESDMSRTDDEPDPSPVERQTPEDEASRNQTRRRLEAAIDVLPPIYRCVFILRAVEGLSVADTAAALEISCDLVRTRYLRARGLLQSHLDADPGMQLSATHDFLGKRCDDTVREVLARLRALGVVRDH